jgi:hypothetical protein
MDITEIIELENIRQLKYRYLRGVDTHDIELLRTCFAEEATASYSGGAYTLAGRDQILKFIADVMDPSSWSSHIALSPEISFIDQDHAEGIWRLQDTVQFTKSNPAVTHTKIEGGVELQGAGYYHDRYIRLNGDWKINYIGYNRIYERIMRMDGHLSVDECRGIAPGMRGHRV